MTLHTAHRDLDSRPELEAAPLANRRRRWVQAGAGLGVAALLLAGCGSAGAGESDGASGTGDAAQTEDSLELPEGWTHVVGETDFEGIQAEPQLPVTMTDGTGTEVEITDVSQIISAGDGVSSTLGALGLGENLYAAPHDSVSAEGIDAPEHFEFSKQTGVEGLLAMDGTLFIGDNTNRHGDVAQQFRDAGTDAAVLDDQDSQAEKLQMVADMVGDPEAGEQLVAQLEKDFAEAEQLVAEADLSELRVIQLTATGAGGANAVAGTGTPGTEVLEELGVVAVGAESGLRGFSVEFSNEGILAENPDVVLITEADYEKWGGEEGLWEAFPTLQQTPAGQNADIVVMPDSQLKYSGPELGAGAKALAEHLVATR